MTRVRRTKCVSFRPSIELLERRLVPTTLMPTTFADGVLGSGSLRDAVLQFNADSGTDDDIIQLQAGTYALTLPNTGGHHETAGLEGDLNITSTAHRLIIQGAGSSGANATIVDASQLQDRVFQIVNPGTVVVFQDLVIQGGLAQDDGSDGALAGSTDALGGGILNNGGQVTLDDVVVQNNVAWDGDAAARATPGHNASGGGIYSNGGALTLEGVTLTNNRAIGGRGGDGIPAFGGGTPAGDGGAALGGGLYATGGTLDISESMATSNQATGGRGGDGDTGFGNRGGSGESGLGGGLYVNGGSLTIATSAIASNQATGGDAGINAASDGNSAAVIGNGSGGGVYNVGTLTISDSTLSGNSVNSFFVDNIKGFGGGVYNGGTLTVSTSTLSGNTGGGGGGIYNSGGALTVSDSTLSSNSANDFFFQDSGGGGLRVVGGSAVLHNTLIAGNVRRTTRSDVSGALNTGGDYNLIGDGTGMSGLSNGVNGNQVGSAAAPIDPLLGPLQDNGGPTKTRALLAGSPALNAGNPSQLGVADQRGVVRSGGVNIGAYQASTTAFVLTAPVTATAGTAFDATVQAVDPFGQTAVGYRGTVHFGSADGQAVLPSDYAFNSGDAGLHTFSGALTLKTAGNQTVTATDTATASITGSASVSVNPAAADHLLFLQPPTDTPAGQTLSPVIVEIVDAFGNVETDDNSDTITLSLGSNPSGGTLGGTLTVTVSGGIATFSDLAIDVVGDGYTLHAMATGLTDADSAAFRVT